MPISKADLIEELRTKPSEQVVQERIIGGEPVVFAHDPELYQVLRSHLAAKLTVSPQDITIVGSGKIGFSLDPNSFGRAFSTRSDVDVVVVDERLFDQIWAHLLDWRYPWHLRKWPDRDLEWGVARLEEFICGRCTPDGIKYHGLQHARLLRPLRELSNRWFDAFRSLSQYPALASRDYNGRLYRTWQHAIRYHASGMSAILQGAPTRT